MTARGAGPDLPDIWQGIDVKWSADWAPEPAAIKTATKLLSLLSEQAAMPISATRGYWPTVSLQWEGGQIEVEVFASHCELYHFKDGQLVGAAIPQFKASKAGIAPLLAALATIARPPPG
ncbi:hypothetical protein [Tropicibacter oceani]|uniref:Uncharacterized protein n=1 Tax=Tropicibacter oceani TaxID=3058420 RepID=A0ABY8QJL5_9RHOB|nr:hypothetical protein [Tropicibacter oceani]WGW04820.1 hypothetical protein QF118_04510 [Tropicibacter oceani]